MVKTPDKPYVASITSRDVAKLANVSVATVSRVANGTGGVSANTRAKVLTAISTLQYCPNAHAAVMGRTKRGNSRRRAIHVFALAGTKAEQTLCSVDDMRNTSRLTGRLCSMEDEYPRVRRLVAKLYRDLEKLRSIIQ